MAYVATANSAMAVKAAKAGVVLDALKSLLPAITVTEIVIVAKACVEAQLFDQADLVVALRSLIDFTNRPH